MIETQFFTVPAEGEPTLIGTIKLDFTDDLTEQVTYNGDEALLSRFGRDIPVFAKLPSGITRTVTLAEAPAYWLRTIPGKFSNGYGRAFVIADDEMDPDNLDLLPDAPPETGDGSGLDEDA